MKALSLDAVIIKESDSDRGCFAFIRQFPAAAVSVDDMSDLDEALESALLDVMDYEQASKNE